MDDIDLALKKVQLQREQLALEEELRERDWNDKKNSAAKNGVLFAIGGIGGCFTQLRRFMARWWK